MIADTVLYWVLNQEKLHYICDQKELPRIDLLEYRASF